MKINKILEYLIDDIDKIMTLTENFIYPYKGFHPRNLYKTESNYKRALSTLEKQDLIVRPS